MTEQGNRDSNGRWLKGTTGNAASEDRPFTNVSFNALANFVFDAAIETQRLGLRKPSGTVRFNLPLGLRV